MMMYWAWRWSTEEMTYSLFDYRKTWIVLDKEEHHGIIRGKEIDGILLWMYVELIIWIRPNRQQHQMSGRFLIIERFNMDCSVILERIWRAEQQTKNSLLLLFLLSLVLSFGYSKRDVQWCYLLVDCQIGWSCFSHFFSSSSLPLDLSIHRADSSSTTTTTMSQHRKEEEEEERVNEREKKRGSRLYVLSTFTFDS